MNLAISILIFQSEKTEYKYFKALRGNENKIKYDWITTNGYQVFYSTM